MSMSLHHFTAPQLAAFECRRALRVGGSIVVRTGTRERIPTYPYYPFFPGSHPILEEVLPRVAAATHLFEAAGLCTVSSELVSQTIAPDWHTYADKLGANADSVLARLSRAEFDEGIRAVRRHAGESVAEPVVEQIDLLVFRV
jgi:hypothetical protein